MAEHVTTHPWQYAVAPFNIAGNLYYVGNRSVSSHLIDTGDGLLLIDTAYPQTLYLLLESIRRLGFNPDDLAYILHTHGHYDHFGGTRALVELTGARMCLGEGDIEILTTRPELSWAPEYGVEFHETFQVDQPLHDGDVLALGNARIECVGTPGHTAGTMSFFFDVEENGQTYVVGMHGGPGLNTLSDEYLAKNNLPKSRRDDYLKSLERLRTRHVDIHIGCHPGQSNTLEKHARRDAETNPFVDVASWPAYLDKLAENAHRLFDEGEEQ